VGAGDDKAAAGAAGQWGGCRRIGNPTEKVGIYGSVWAYWPSVWSDRIRLGRPLEVGVRVAACMGMLVVSAAVS
jgi:hypothetical protein